MNDQIARQLAQALRRIAVAREPQHTTGEPDNLATIRYQISNLINRMEALELRHHELEHEPTEPDPTPPHGTPRPPVQIPTCPQLCITVQQCMTARTCLADR